MILAILYILSSLFAVPSLSLASQDTQIKNNAAYMMGVVHEFMNNNNGRLPTDVDFETLVADNIYKNPLTGTFYTADSYFPGEHCDGTQKPRAVSIKVKLTDGSEVCLD